MKKFDIIIVGAGAAGSVAAYFGARLGYHVCLIDGKPQDKIGDKICGDGIAAQIFDFLKIPRPKLGEYMNVIQGTKLYPPDTRYPIIIKDRTQSGYVIDRLRFGQRLLNDAIDAGAILNHSTHAVSPIIKKDQVIGIKIRSKHLEEDEIYANAVLDASGFHTIMRKQIDFPFLQKEIDPKDYIVCYREIVRLDNPVVYDQDFISIYMDNKRAPGGYVWYFTRNEYEVNIGFGVSPIYKHQLRELYEKFVYQPFIGNESCNRITGGSGLVSVCKPLYTGVANGIMFVGDAAMQVNPISGGGLIPCMQAGYYAIQGFSKAMEMEKFDALGLWNYNSLFQKTIGAEFAALDILRLAIQKFPNEVFDFALKNQLVTGDEISGVASSGEMNPPILEMLGKIIRGISRPKILLELNFLRKKMSEIKSIYKRYPTSPICLENWVKDVESLYSTVQNRLKSNSS